MLCVSAPRDGHRPVILGDARPEHPYHYDGEQSEQCFEKSAVDLAAGAAANIYADNVFEDLPDCKEDDSRYEVDYRCVSKVQFVLRESVRIGFRSPRTRSTRYASRRKNRTKKTSGASW